MSLKDMLICIKNNDLRCLQLIMEDDDTYLTEKILTKLLIECLEIGSRMKIASYIINTYEFDLVGDIFEKYLETNRPFTTNQINDLNKIFGKFFICCLVDS